MSLCLATLLLLNIAVPVFSVSPGADVKGVEAGLFTSDNKQTSRDDNCCPMTIVFNENEDEENVCQNSATKRQIQRAESLYLKELSNCKLTGLSDRLFSCGRKLMCA